MAGKREEKSEGGDLLTVVIAWDTELWQPACPALQTQRGGSAELIEKHFDPETWLMEPTPGMVNRRIEPRFIARLAKDAMKRSQEPTLKRKAG